MTYRKFTLNDIKKSKCADLNPHVFELDSPKEEKEKKFHNEITDVDGIKFDSKKEAKRYKVLRLLLKQGVIGFLARQTQYELNPGGPFSYIYIDDFSYVITETGEKIIEDCKGLRTKEYIRKRKLMKQIYGITIKET